ncbi:MAG: ABC-F family ATP-binding cassette domain-containing protein [Candidatus Omnitrophota bacterium]|nr:MAG: ABC-F family ATP-binding cassette domain-containing protein [Candidatus Omnitrophota bacterium]
MITIGGLSKSYGGKVLFDNISLAINRGEKIGLIGPNGSGKSTFFSLILATTEPGSGRIHINKNVRIGHLPQEASFKSDRTVLLELTEGDDEIIRLKMEKDKLEEGDDTAAVRYGEVLHQLEVLGYFELEYKAKKVLSGLGFKEKDFSRPVSELSGGWQMRVLLAKLLVHHYDVLLLDEPTNYLDLGAALWFKDYLIGFKGTFVMISHDRTFLDEVANYTLVLEEGAIAKVKGNYEHYLKIRQQKRSHALKHFREQEKKKEQLKKFISRFHAQPNKAAQVRAKRRFLEKMEKIEVPQDLRESIRKFHFPKSRSSGQKVLTLEKISKSYPGIRVYKDFDFEVQKDEKAVLVGENGAGKSTLLKILAGVVDTDSGSRYLGHNVDIGYFSQTRMEVLNPYNTVLEEAHSVAGPDMSAESVRTILGAFLFSGDDADKSVKVLSGGEKSRLILAKLLIRPPNFLLLDEPTTHLDVDAVEALIKALKEFNGTLVFISHDIHFVRSVANTVFEVKEGRVRKFPGNFDYYLSRKDKGQLYAEERKQRGAKLKKDKEGAQEILSQRERRVLNARISDKIRKLRLRREKLQTEKYVVARVLSNPRHSRETVREYEKKLEKIEKKIKTTDNKINELKVRFV